jgi:hypothetical protein
MVGSRIENLYGNMREKLKAPYSFSLENGKYQARDYMNGADNGNTGTTSPCMLPRPGALHS